MQGAKLYAEVIPDEVNTEREFQGLNVGGSSRKKGVIPNNSK